MSSDDGLEPQQLPTPGSNDPTKIRQNPLHAAQTVSQPVPVAPPEEIPGRGGAPLTVVAVVAGIGVLLALLGLIATVVLFLL